MRGGVFSGATLISQIHPGGSRPATLVSVQTPNFLAEATRITAQPSAPSLSPRSISNSHLPAPPPLQNVSLALFISHSISPLHPHDLYAADAGRLEANTCVGGGEVISDAHALFPNLMVNNAAYKHTHTHTGPSLTITASMCGTINKWRSDYGAASHESLF